jgi:N-acetylmuramic acid 6-phosphate etherase
MPTLPPDRAHIDTEKRNPRTQHLHTLDTPALVELIQGEDRQVLLALKRAADRLVKLITAAEPGFLAGGRLIYVGAGTSGRLGVLDASEAPPTFCVPPTRVVALIAGGDSALRQSSEGAEDDPQGAWPALDALHLTSNDTLIAIAAGGTTPFALGALDYCKQPSRLETARPTTALLCCTAVDRPASADHLVIIKTGPEVITGSTRLKAGTATKLALNTISTTLMIRAGKVYQNLMVDLKASNAKLRDRAARIITQLTGLSRDDAFTLLDRCDGEVKVAVIVHRLSISPEAARDRLSAAQGHLHEVLTI